MGNYFKTAFTTLLLLGLLTGASPLNNPEDTSGFGVESVPSTACIAVGTDAICAGDGAVAGNAASDLGTLAIGATSTTTGVSAIAIGENADATGANSVAIGGHMTDSDSADATAQNAVAIGPRSLADGNNSIAIGNGSDSGGSRSIAIGDGANASADSTVALGRLTDATGVGCIAIGGNVTDADSADCSAVDSVAIGQHILAADIGQYIFGSGEFAAQSDASRSFYILRNSTTDATQTELFADGSAGDISVPSDCTIVFDLLLVARQTDADDVEAGYKLEGVIGNNAGTTAFVGTIGKTVLAEDVAAWDVTATADDTNDGLNVLVTGASSTAIQWVAYVNTVKTCG